MDGCHWKPSIWVGKAVQLGNAVPKLTKRLIDNLSGEAGDRIEWDTELRGFGVRVTTKGVKSFVIQYRNTSGRSRRHTIGQFGTWTVDEARTEARALLVEVDKGGDPVETKQARRGGTDSR